MKKPAKPVDIKEELRVHIARKYHNQSEAAKEWGCSAALVSAVLKGRKSPNKKMLDDAGFERITTPDTYVVKRIDELAPPKEKA